MMLEDPYHQEEPETQALVANAETQDLKNAEPQEIELPKETSVVSETEPETVVVSQALIGEEGFVQQRSSGAAQAHPLAFVIILLATVLGTAGFFFMERRVLKNTKHSYAFVKSLSYRRNTSYRR